MLKKSFQFINRLFQSIDKATKRLITGFNPDSVTLPDIKPLTDGHFITREHWKAWDVYSDVFGIIDTKASSLLTHISIIIAVVAIAKPHDGVLGAIALILLLLYIMAAYLALRCLRFWSFREDAFDPVTRGSVGDEEVERQLRLEMLFRQEMFRTSLNMTSVLTLASVLLVVAASL